MSRKPRLGRGLDALLGSARQAADPVPTAIEEPATEGPLAADASAPVGEQLLRLEVESLQRGRYQPRREMDPERLEELAASIRSQGMMQPIVARALASGGYEIVAGERRWRAAQLAGLDRVPVIVRELSDEAAMALSLIENIQREALNPIEEAFALQRLVEEFGFTQQAVAETVGRSRAAVANMLRLLRLRGEVRDMLERGDIEMGHARALLTLPEARQLVIARDVIEKGLSVRQTEALARRATQEDEAGGSATIRPARDPDTVALERRLSEQVGAPVAIRHGASGKGQVVIRYSSLDELDGILDHIK